MFLDPNTSSSLQTALAADAHLVEGQFLQYAEEELGDQQFPEQKSKI
jgi:hypothetical protein